jgi:hypothetical protein
VGFGVALVAAPVLMLMQPALVPGPMILAAWTLTLLIVVRDRRGVDWFGLSWAVPGLLLGTAAAVALLDDLSDQGLAVLFGVLVLIAVALSAIGWRPLPRRGLVLSAAAATGLMGTLTSVGGPPMALVYQGTSGARLRGTLSAVFLVGGALSLGGLWLSDRFGASELAGGLGLLPGIVAGFALSGPLAAYLDRRLLRPAVLAVAGGAALLVLGRALAA